MKTPVLCVVCCVLLSFVANADVQADFRSKVYALEKSAGSHGSAEFNSTAEESDPDEEKTEEHFVHDLKNSFEARGATIGRFSDFSRMTEKDTWALRELGVLAERNFYEKYKAGDIPFENARLKVLCESYLSGLEEQMDAVSEYGEIESLPKEERPAKEKELELRYSDGSLKRQSIVSELNFIADMGVVTDHLAVSEDFASIIENAKTQEIPSEVVMRIQHALNEKGFSAGEEDGVIGANTVLAICDYQRLAGLEPDGLITQDLMESLGFEEW